MSEIKRILVLASIIRKEHMFSHRTKIMLPILLLFIPGFAWGFSDPNVVLPGGIQPSNAMEILYYTSIGVLFSATIFAVLIAHDGISKERISGVLELRLSQPMSRSSQTTALVWGHWQSSFIPILACSILAIVAIFVRRDMLPTIVEMLCFVVAVGVLVLWYTLLSLIASSYATEQSTSIAFGIGTWFLFTFLWALVTSMVAFASGVAVGQPNDPEWIQLEGYLDLLSPNGVFHHLLETQMPTIERGVATSMTIFAIALWSIAPWYILQRRIQHLSL
ncbi:MAG: ABC transporter permease subunit [archaeon]|nr:ABC transporter permease subunit [archaeon]